MSVTMIQASFQFGEVTRLMHARVDSPIYYRSVKRLRNMVVIPQGGAKRRFGQTFIDQINDHAMSPTYLSDYRQVKPFIFDYENGDRYLLIFRPLAVDIYLNGVYQSTTVTTYTTSEIVDLCITQSARIVFITHGAHAPATLIVASLLPVVLTLTTPTFIEYPTFDFKQTYGTFTFQVKVGGVLIVTSQNLLGQVVTITSSAALFDTNYVGGLFIGEGGTIRITEYSSSTVVVGRIINVFDNESSLFHAGSGNAIAGADCVVTEIAFSATRGFPQKVSFFQNRIFFGRTATLAGGIWGSNYNGYTSDKLHFDDSEALDTNAISTILQGIKATVIQSMVAFKTLLVFTSSGLYSSPLLIDLPLTPQNIAFLNPQTSDSSNAVVPLIFDNDVIFFDKGGRKVKNVNVYATTQHYESKVISVLAPHLVDQPYSAAVFENSSTEDGNWMFMVNNGSNIPGTLAIYQSVPEQEITAWSLAVTAPTGLGENFSYYRHVVSDEETTFFIIERVVNGQTRLFIEQLDFNVYTDAAKSGTQALSATITGLDYLEGETVAVRGKPDGSSGQSVITLDAVVTGGSITLDTEVTDYEVGLLWTPELVPLPINVPMPNGNNLYLPKNIKCLYVDFYESLGIYVDNVLIPPFRFNEDTYNDPADPKTDFVQIQPMSGWDPDVEIPITQLQPLPMTILGICFLVSLTTS